VRMVLVPSVMELLGDANWYLPRRLDRILPTLGVEMDVDELEETPADPKARHPVP
jgi:putative drug exporter of the RND superfamily